MYSEFALYHPATANKIANCFAMRKSVVKPGACAVAAAGVAAPDPAAANAAVAGATAIAVTNAAAGTAATLAAATVAGVAASATATGEIFEAAIIYNVRRLPIETVTSS